MSKLHVQIDYVVASTIIKGLRGWLDKLSDILDKAVLEQEVEDKTLNKETKSNGTIN